MKLKFITPKSNLAKTIDQWMTPAFPSWFKNIEVPQDEALRLDFKTARHCPAFVQLFKNAHLLRAPQDISLHCRADHEIGLKNPNQADQVDLAFFDFERQMGEEWTKYFSIKFDLKGVFVPEESMTAMFFDPMYHLDKKTPLTTMTGVWPMHPDLYTHVAINMMAQRHCFDDGGYLHIKCGTPLAYLYWPQGKPTIETEVVSEEEYEQKHVYIRNHFIGDFITKEKELANAV